jgi:hypothetical protein
MQASFFIQLGHPTTVTLESFLINGRQDALLVTLSFLVWWLIPWGVVLI